MSPIILRCSNTWSLVGGYFGGGGVEIRRYGLVGETMSKRSGLEVLKRLLPFPVCPVLPICSLGYELSAVLAAMPSLCHHGL